MTDGEIFDIQTTIDQVVRLSGLPISIVIVGVGGEKFENMEKLDADIYPLKSQIYGQAKRDIVQFVPYRQFASNPQLLASHTLAELPKQVS